MGLGRVFITLGAIFFLIGMLLLLGERLPGGLPLQLGRLPGDIQIRGKYGVFYFPLVTCLLASLVLSFLFWLFSRR